jgi:hypothetical protein
MERKRIVILGSKPDPVLATGDSIYCANSSIGSYQDYISKFEHIVSVTSSWAIDSKSDDNDLKITKKNIILNSYADKYVITDCDDPRCFISIDKLYQAFNHQNSSAIVSFLTYRETCELTRKISNLKQPYISSSFFKMPIYKQLWATKSLCLTLLRKILKPGCFAPWNSYFRESTGLFSLIYAIYENGLDCDYIIIGIGVSDRNVYKMDEQFITHRFKDVDVLVRHTYADFKILRKLSQEYSIYTTDFDLSSSANLRLLDPI